MENQRSPDTLGLVDSSYSRMLLLGVLTFLRIMYVTIKGQMETAPPVQTSVCRVKGAYAHFANLIIAWLCRATVGNID